MTTKGWRVSRVGWVGLALSILAVVVLYVNFWLFERALQYGTGSRPVGIDRAVVLWPWSFFIGFALFVAGIVVDIVAGTRGRGNRLVGIIGGLVMLAPLVWALATNLFPFAID